MQIKYHFLEFQKHLKYVLFLAEAVFLCHV